MTEPASTTTAAAIAAGAITFTGSILGISFDALLIGFVGTLAALSFQDESRLLKLLSGMLLATLCAGLLSPAGANALWHLASWLAPSAEQLRIPVAGLLGMTTQLLFPIGIARLGSLIKTTGGQKQ